MGIKTCDRKHKVKEISIRLGFVSHYCLRQKYTIFKDVKTAVRLNTKDGVIDDAIALPGLLIFFWLF